MPAHDDGTAEAAKFAALLRALKEPTAPSYRSLATHVKAGGALPAQPGELVVQGKALGAWIAGQEVG